MRQVAQGQWPNLFSLVDTVMGVLVLYGMGARWSRSPAPVAQHPEATLPE